MRMKRVNVTIISRTRICMTIIVWQREILNMIESDLMKGSNETLWNYTRIWVSWIETQQREISKKIVLAILHLLSLKLFFSVFRWPKNEKINSDSIHFDMVKMFDIFPNWTRAAMIIQMVRSSNYCQVVFEGYTIPVMVAGEVKSFSMEAFVFWWYYL